MFVFGVFIRLSILTNPVASPNDSFLSTADHTRNLELGVLVWKQVAVNSANVTPNVIYFPPPRDSCRFKIVVVVPHASMFSLDCVIPVEQFLPRMISDDLSYLSL